MRIALITPGFSASEKDWCIPVLLNLVRKLTREHDVQVFTLRYPHHRRTYAIGGATVHAFGGAETSGFGRFLLLQQALRRMLRLHRSEPFDVIQGFWADDPGLLAVMAGRITGVPAVVSIMGGELVSFPDIGYGGWLGIVNPKMTALSLRHATRVTVGSRYLQSLAQQHVAAGKLHQLPLGIDTGRFFPSEPDRPVGPTLNGCPALISVGSLTPVKGHPVLVDAVAQLSKEFRDVHLHLVGDGPLGHQLQRRSQSLGIEHSVTLHGAVPHHDLPDFYRSADLFVSSSRHESQGLAALEAAACGCPVLGTAVGILPEISSPSGSIPPDDPAALASGIRSLCSDTERRSALRTSALQRVQSEFSLDITVGRLLRLYREITG
jgi:glycosyltransferase involved in cell wall biosynthesis